MLSRCFVFVWFYYFYFSAKPLASEISFVLLSASPGNREKDGKFMIMVSAHLAISVKTNADGLLQPRCLEKSSGLHFITIVSRGAELSVISTWVKDLWSV